MGSRPIAAALFLISLATHLVFSCGGVRSPDAEVVFRTAEALAGRGSFALEKDLELWPGFGAPVGPDGRRHSIFGAGQAIVAAPFVRLGQALNRTRWYEGHERLILASHDQGTGLVEFRMGRVPAAVEPHALRFQVALLNALVTAATVVVLFVILLNLTGSLARLGLSLRNDEAGQRGSPEPALATARDAHGGTLWRSLVSTHRRSSGNPC